MAAVLKDPQALPAPAPVHQLHHVAYRVADVEGALASLATAGLRLIDEHPRNGIRGSRVAFLHPASTGGVLTEIVQPAHH